MKFLSNYKPLLLGLLIGGLLIALGNTFKVAGILFQAIAFGLGASIIFYGIFNQIKEWRTFGNYPFAKLINNKKKKKKGVIAVKPKAKKLEANPLKK